MRRHSALRKIWLLRALGALVLALTFGYLPYHLYAHSGFARYLQLRGELHRVRAINSHFATNNGRLRREAEALQSEDLRTIERAARAELGFVRAGEVVFEIEDAPQGRTP